MGRILSVAQTVLHEVIGLFRPSCVSFDKSYLLLLLLLLLQLCCSFFTASRSLCGLGFFAGP